MCHIHTGILFCHEQGQSSDTRYNLENMMLSEKSQTHKARHTVCDSIYVKCPEQESPQRQEVGSWLPGAGVGADC